MRHLVYRSMAVLIALSPIAALAGIPKATPPVRSESQLLTSFVEAGKAYDEGRLDQAAQLYSELTDSGFQTPEVLHNLGNVYFRQGLIGQAVLAYRRAWFLSPRDPDIRANLRFAQQTTGAASPPSGLLTRIANMLSVGEWAAVATAAYWLLFAAIAFLLLKPSLRAWAAHLLTPICLVLGCALGGMMYWDSLNRTPEIVVIADQQQALFAPLENSTAHFALPPGSITRRVGSSGPWLKVMVDGKEGWVPESACETVRSNQAPLE